MSAPLHNWRNKAFNERPGWPRWFWPFLLALTTLFFGALYTAEQQLNLSADWQVEAVRIVDGSESSGVTAPPVQLDTAEVSGLPSWRFVPESEGSRDDLYRGWVSIDAPAVASDEPLLLIIPRPYFNRFALWLDGREQDERGFGPNTYLKQPIAFEIPPGYGGSEGRIVLQVIGAFDRGYVGTMHLGPKAALDDHFAGLQFVRETLVNAILAMMAIMSFMLAIIHRMRFREETVYGWCALGIFAWFVHTFQGVLERPGFGNGYFWESIGYLTLGLFVSTSAVFTNRVVNRPQPRIELFQLTVTIVAGSVIVYRGTEQLLLGWVLNLLWIPWILLIGAYMVVQLVRGARREPTSDALILLAITGLVFLVGVRDYLFNNLQLIPGAMLYLKYAAGATLIGYAFVLVRRFARSLKETRQRNDALLEARGAQEALLRYQSLLIAEHDELNRHIQALIDATAEQTQTAALRSSLEAARSDLRLIIDALDPDTTAAGTLLDALASRLADQARAADIIFGWDEAEAFPFDQLQPHQQLTITRILQMTTREALASPDCLALAIRTTQDETHAGLEIEARFRSAVAVAFGRDAHYERLMAELAGTATLTQDGHRQQLRLRWPIHPEVS